MLQTLTFLCGVLGKFKQGNVFIVALDETNEAEPDHRGVFVVYMVGDREAGRRCRGGVRVRRLEALAVDDGWARLVVLLLRDPHLSLIVRIVWFLQILNRKPVGRWRARPRWNRRSRRSTCAPVAQ